MDEWIKKMWYICTMVLFSLKKEGNSVIWDKMGEPGEHYAK